MIARHGRMTMKTCRAVKSCPVVAMKKRANALSVNAVARDLTMKKNARINVRMMKNDLPLLRT